MKTRIILGVVALWVVLGVLWGAQSAMGTALRGGDPVPLGRAVHLALIQTLPLAPLSLVAIALAMRFPLGGARGWRALSIHLAALLALAWIANVLVVLGHWASVGQWNGVVALARGGVVWATVNFHVALIVYVGAVGTTHGVLYYRRTRDRELQMAKLEGQLARAHVQALTAQIRPHFLFNTLHTIGQLWRSGRSDAADSVLDSLGALFHKVQRSTSRVEVPLGEELEMVREYLAIEQARFRDRLNARVEASPEAIDCLVPPLILQPLVENAVRHGISAVSTAGLIAVTARVADGLLRLAVHDDGPGTATPSAQPGSGTGLANTRERLAQLYGSRASLRIDGSPAGGTVVTIELPATNGNGRFGG